MDSAKLHWLGSPLGEGLIFRQDGPMPDWQRNTFRYQSAVGILPADLTLPESGAMPERAHLQDRKSYY